MKIIILDPYKKSNSKINKDQAGGYGTSNEFGDNFFNLILSYFVKKLIQYPPLYVAYSISVLKKKGYDVTYENDVDLVNNVDLCLVTSSIVCHETELEVLKKLKKREIYTGVIGSFCTAVPDLYIKESDFVISGEPEFFLLKEDINILIKEKKRGILKSVLDKNLDKLPFPAWEVFFNSGGPKAFFINKFGKTIPILASRGCPYSCFNYCTYPTQQGKVVRRRSVKNIISEIKLWKEKYNINSFLFRDPVFSINNPQTEQFCNELIKEDLKIKFGIETHLNNLNVQIAKKLYSAGLRYVEVGIESSSDEVLKDCKRFSIKKEREIDLVKTIEKIGLKVKTMFIYGLPLDNYKSCLDTLNFSKRINATYSQFSIFTPYPGTPIYDTEYKNKILTKKFEDFTQWQLVFKHKNLSTENLKNLVKKSYKEYYFRLGWLLKYFKIYKS